MTWTPAQQQLLFTLQIALKNQAETDEKTLREIGQDIFDRDLLDWKTAYLELEKADFIKIDNGICHLQEKGMEVMVEIIREQHQERFSDMLIRCESSATCSEFNRRLHGKDLCQFNMMSMDQLETMLTKLDLKPGEKVLDIGCGIGTVTEYISDVTGACITGVDFARKAIERARERTEEKRDRLDFVVGNMNDLMFPDQTFDAVISIDTLYFVRDLEPVVKKLVKIMKPGGRMGIFWSQYVSENQTAQVLDRDETGIARIARDTGLKYETVEYSHEEIEYWKRTLELAEELKDRFEAEGNLPIYNGRVGEAESILERINAGGISRFYYQLK